MKNFLIVACSVLVACSGGGNSEGIDAQLLDSQGSVMDTLQVDAEISDGAVEVDATIVDAISFDSGVDALIPDGLIPDGLIPDGLIPDGLIPDGLISDGLIPECGAIGTLCGPTMPCEDGLFCYTGLIGGVCAPERDLCGGFTGVMCGEEAPICMSIVGTDIGLCATGEEKDCLCTGAGTFFPSCEE